jgi:hypothetical protein
MSATANGFRDLFCFDKMAGEYVEEAVGSYNVLLVILNSLVG